MSFLFPNFLFFFFALLIPIAIHLFNFRRYRKIEFTNVRLLKDIEISTKSTKKLKNWLILLSRLLAMIFLILAFAQPFIPAKQTNTKKGDATLIFLDNSFSMNEGNIGNSLLDLARSSCQDLVYENGNSGVYHLITNDFEHSEFNPLSHEEILIELDKVTISHNSKSFNELYNRIKSIKSQLSDQILHIYLFSDFQLSQFNNFKTENDSSLLFHFIQIRIDNSSNLSIDSCWMLNPIQSSEGTDSVYVKLSNYGPDIIENHPVKLFVNNQQISLNTTNIDPWDSKVISMPYSETEFGFFKGKIETSDDGLSEDDELFFSFNVDSTVGIYELGPLAPNRSFETIYSRPFKFIHSSDKNVDISQLNLSDVFLINGKSELSVGLINEISHKVFEGSNLILYFDNHQDLTSINQTLNYLKLEMFKPFDTTGVTISTLNTKSSLLLNSIENVPENADFPTAHGYFPLLEKLNLLKENILVFNNGAPALRKYQHGKGSYFIFTFGMEPGNSNFTKHSLFVPIALNMAYSSKLRSNLYSLIGSKDDIEVSFNNDENESAIHVTGVDLDVIPELKNRRGKTFVQLHDQVEQAGNYEIKDNGLLADVISLNFSRKESDIRRHTETTLNEAILSAGLINTEVISEKENQLISAKFLQNKANFFWKYCVILALMFFVSEVIIIKLFKG